MRIQRRPPVNVVVAHLATTSDMGNETETATGTLVTGALFNPAQPLERASNDLAAVVQPASFDLPGVIAVDADDLLHVTDLAELPSDPDQLDTLLKTVTPQTWQADGGGIVLLDRTKVAVRQPRST